MNSLALHFVPEGENAKNSIIEVEEENKSTSYRNLEATPTERAAEVDY